MAEQKRAADQLAGALGSAVSDTDLGMPDLIATARYHERMTIVGPADDDMAAVDQLQAALKLLGKLCVDVMTTGSGDWSRTARELEKAAGICRNRVKPELPPACRTAWRSVRPPEAPDRFPIYENRTVS